MHLLLIIRMPDNKYLIGAKISKISYKTIRRSLVSNLIADTDTLHI